MLENKNNEMLDWGFIVEFGFFTWPKPEDDWSLQDKCHTHENYTKWSVNLPFLIVHQLLHDLKRINIITSIYVY